MEKNLSHFAGKYSKRHNSNRKRCQPSELVLTMKSVFFIMSSRWSHWPSY